MSTSIQELVASTQDKLVELRVVAERYPDAHLCNVTGTRQIIVAANVVKDSKHIDLIPVPGESPLMIPYALVGDTRVYDQNKVYISPNVQTFFHLLHGPGGNPELYQALLDRLIAYK